jgi:hypothetical protein
LHRAVLALRKLAKTNVQTNLCDRREPANTSSLYLAVTHSPSLPCESCHVSSIVCSRSIADSLVRLAHWRISDGITPIVGQNLQFVPVEPCGRLRPRHAGSGDLLSETRSFDDKFDAVGAPPAEREGLRKHAEHLRNSPPKSVETTAQKKPLRRQEETPRNRYSVRTDSGPIPLQAFWGMHVEAMNFSGMGQGRACRGAGLSPHSLHIWRDRLKQCGGEMDWRSQLHRSARVQLSSAANTAL